MPNTLRVSIGIACCLGLPALPVAAGTPIYIGVLEGPQTDANQPNPPISSRRHVRIAFQREGSEWKPMDTAFGTPAALADVSHYYPPSVNWTVVFNGKAIGHISSRDPGALHWYADVGTQIITTAAAHVPVVRTGAGEFVYVINEATMRPLLLVSVPHYRDPQAWKPTTLTATERASAIAAFRAQVHSSERCDAPEQSPIHMVSYTDDKIHLIKAYRSNEGQVLFGEELKDSQANCGFFDDEHFFDYWFVIDHQQHVRYLDRQMTPMEAADIDNSGRSAWIFLTWRGAGQNGYKLFYGDDLRRVAAFDWNYH
jgi:hypothetical protein